MGKLIDLTDQRFGRLVVIERQGQANSGHAEWLCKCDCGKEVIVSSNALRSSRGTRSCGCLQREMATIANLNKDHGYYKKKASVGREHQRLHQTWRDMINRCANSNNKRFDAYGGRGISVCQEWLGNFDAFKEWAISSGYSDELTIDRINVNGDYCPQNCRWATSKEQNNNRSNNRIVIYKGESMTLHQLADREGINYQTLWNRLKYGWSLEDAVERPIRRW